MRLQKMAQRKWLELCTRLGLGDGPALKWWEWLYSRYGEPQRHYHTMEHIESMLELQDKHCEGKIQNNAEFQLAIFFHDVIYDPKAKDNEKQSADWAVKFINETTESLESSSSLTINPNNVYDMILLTETHKTPAHTEGHNFGTNDEHFLLDLDMSILGQTWSVYARYAGNIRREYCHIPHSDYCQKRAEVLKSFLKVHRIYCTSEFHIMKNLQEIILKRKYHSSLIIKYHQSNL
ncbi:PREDICTED: uncharacterized protein LOC105312645 isoform X2 [Amphimedon queenslandica]|uniref:HD domain-containing protein n=1 Tax=Amphimedon queenslandica TaxID=400682 RepID=A0AAN0J3N7_AMPQE|nr:PREDICTED: uncharacterized protein LOC105312645 isoform X2 [Amphimedon queenslandica]|eukprot:XP_019851634.1 PREDICTED: uncharacterized protein LOC105312645 isoform X2 [Amphimedon queenslandica]